MMKNRKSIKEEAKDKANEVLTEILKRTWANIKTIRHMFSFKKPYIVKKEAYVFLFVALITAIWLFNHNMPKLFYILCLNYFVWKSIFQIGKENIFAQKFKGISKMFDGKVKVIEEKDGILKLHSYIPFDEINAKKNKIEHYLNKRISSITQHETNFKLIYIEVEDKKSKINLKAKYHLSKYIKKANIKGKKLPFLLGIDKFGKQIIGDLKDIKHFLISGESGGGKSTLFNAIIQSLMYYNPSIAFMFVDFKRVELNVYKKFKNALFVKTQKKFLELLRNLSAEMDKRYDIMEENEFTDIEQYNKLNPKDKFSTVVLGIDEIADIGAEDADEINDLLLRLLQMGRAAGIHIIAATQRPSGVQLSTEVRAALLGKISFAILDPITQKMTGVMCTEKLKVGEFKSVKIGLPKNEVVKGYYVDRINEWDTYRELHNKLAA